MGSKGFLAAHEFLMERSVAYDTTEAGILPGPQGQWSAPKDPCGGTDPGIAGICTSERPALSVDGNGI